MRGPSGTGGAENQPQQEAQRLDQSDCSGPGEYPRIGQAKNIRHWRQLQWLRSFFEMLEHGKFGDVDAGGKGELTSSEGAPRDMEGLIDRVLQSEEQRSASSDLSGTRGGFRRFFSHGWSAGLRWQNLLHRRRHWLR